MRTNIIFLISLLCLPVFSQAHYLWIESEHNTEARIYFGEFNEDVREMAGDRLNERKNLKAYIQHNKENSKPLEFVQKNDHYFTTFDNTDGWILVKDLSNEVMDWRKHNIGIVKPMFYARAAIANKLQPTKPSLTLDILPVISGDQQSYQVYFKDQPLVDAKLKVYAPNLWMQELKTDNSGKINIATPWSGRYVLDIIYLESVSGEFVGTSYEKIRHRSTYSFVK